MRVPAQLPARTGAGLKAEHYRDILAQRPSIGFFEIHAENYMGAGGPPHRYLEAIRNDYPLSLHGVGLSIGGDKPLDRDHLMRLRDLNRRYEPGLFSEHLAWSTHDAGYFADLLPLPYTEDTLKRVCAHIGEVQDVIGRQMLLENPSSYLAFEASTHDEASFIAEIVKRTGCGLLLDVNNVFVSAANLGFSPRDYIDRYPLSHVQEFHLGGHSAQTDGEGLALLIDDHGHPVADPVWDLFAYTVRKAGRLPTLIERDADVPPLDAMVAETVHADHILDHADKLRAA